MNFVRHSPSSLNLFSSCLSMFVLEKVLGKRQPVGLPAHRGTAVEAGIAHGLLDLAAPVEDCIDLAQRKFAELSAFSRDPRLDKFAQSVGPMVTNGLAELRGYGVPSSTQGFIEWRPEGLKYPIVGYYDFMWQDFGIVVDLKTSDTLPSKIKVPHARQVSLYTGGNLQGRVTYCTPSKVATYLLEDVPAHRAALHRMALACERFLALSDDPEFFKGITVPDLDSFYFAPEAARQAAFETWGV